MNNREAHFYLEELQRMMTQHRGIFTEEFVCANGMAILALEQERKKGNGRLIYADELKEWVENWLYKDRYYHNGRVSKTIPVTELYDILEQISMEVEE